MKVYIIVYDSPYDKHESGNPLITNNYAYSSREIAQKHWKELGASRFGFSIKELELLDE